MPQRLSDQFRRLDALIRVYSPPRRARLLFWEHSEDKETESCSSALADDSATASGSNKAPRSSTNACNSRDLLEQHQEDRDDDDSADASGRRSSRRESKRLAQKRWIGTVVEALSDVFTAVWTNYIEPAAEFQTASQLRPSGRPGTDARLVSKAFASDSLMKSRPSFRIHFRLMQEFSRSASLSDWDSNEAVTEYINHLKTDPMIVECCRGLSSRLDTPGLETVESFVATLHQVWFQPLTPNTGKPPRCGYHHVCIGEFHNRSRNVGGMHSWFKFLIEEEKLHTRILNWWSYEKDLHLISMKFNMKHPDFDAWYTKEKSSFLVGVPTDFELLLFTVVTMVNPNKDTSIQIKDYEPLVVVPRSLKKTGSLVTAYFRESPKQIGA